MWDHLVKFGWEERSQKRAVFLSNVILSVKLSADRGDLHPQVAFPKYGKPSCRTSEG